LGGKGSKLESKKKECSMPPTDDDLKARLMAEAEAAIDRLLAKRKSHGQLD
jgi:hypothetical protein